MFSSGQLIFAGCFVLAFVALMIWSYAKDKKRHQIHYKSTAFKVGFACVLTIFIFIVLRIIIH
jgi:glycerol uptake facilitator-like aquaporin